MAMHPPIDLPAHMRDTRFLRNTFGRFASGVTVLTCAADAQVHGMTANSFVSVSLEPARALISVDRRARMHGLMAQTDHFGLSVLSEHQAHISAHFAGKPDAGFTPRFDYAGDVALIAGALAWMACAREQAIDIGDHTLFIGRLLDCGFAHEGLPLLYFGGRYAALAAAKSATAH